MPGPARLPKAVMPEPKKAALCAEVYMNRIQDPNGTAPVPVPDPLVFEVTLEQAQNQDANGSALSARSVIVEVNSQDLLKALAGTPDPVKATRQEAAELACQVAFQTIEKDLPAGVEPACSPSPMPHLPDELQEKAPTLQTPAAAAWLP